MAGAKDWADQANEDVRKYYAANWVALLAMGAKAQQYSISSWSIVVDLRWVNMTNTVSKYATPFSSAPTFANQSTQNGRAVESMGDHMGVLMKVKGQTY